jgi:hypothetical protein
MVEEEEMSTDPREVKVEPEIRRRSSEGFSKEEEEAGRKGNPSRSRRPIRREPGRRRKVEKR